MIQRKSCEEITLEKEPKQSNYLASLDKKGMMGVVLEEKESFIEHLDTARDSITKFSKSARKVEAKLKKTSRG